MYDEIIKKYGHGVGYTESDIESFHKGGHRIRQVERLSKAASKYSIMAEIDKIISGF